MRAESLWAVGQRQMMIQRTGFHQVRLPRNPETDIRVGQQTESVGPIVQFAQHTLVGAESLYAKRYHDRSQPLGIRLRDVIADFPLRRSPAFRPIFRKEKTLISLKPSCS